MIPPFEQSAALAGIMGLKHGFFGRRGGVSTGEFASLNISRSTGDSAADTQENRSRALYALGTDALTCTGLRQIHSNLVITVTADPGPADPPEADGIVTADANIALAISTADCVPVLFADPGAGVIGACHAGWKGAAGGIIENTVAAMTRLGARPGRIIAATGPAISAVNYEVGPQFATAIARDFPHAARHIIWPEDATRAHFDVTGVVRDALANARIAAPDPVGECTYANPERYFSHRYATHQGRSTGRQITLIARTRENR